MLEKLFSRGKAGKKEDSQIQVEINTSDNTLICVGYARWIENNELEIRDRSGENLRSIVYNTPVKVKGRLYSKDISVIQGKIKGSSRDFWRIGEIEVKATKENRQTARQRTNKQAIIAYIQFGLEEKVECKVVDISLGGTLLFISNKSFTKDKQLTVIIKHRGNEIKIPCKVVRTMPGLRGNSYGCQYDKINSKLQSQIAQLVYDMERENRHRIDDIEGS